MHSIPAAQLADPKHECFSGIAPATTHAVSPELVSMTTQFSSVAQPHKGASPQALSTVEGTQAFSADPIPPDPPPDAVPA